MPSPRITIDSLLPLVLNMLFFRHLHFPASLLAFSIFQHISPSSATLLYVASYAGTITTLNLTVPGSRASPATLEVISSTTECAPRPAWLTLDHSNSVLYCTERSANKTGNGTIVSFQSSKDGNLVPLDKLKTLGGGVSSTLFGKRQRGLATAHYDQPSMTSFDISNPRAIKPIQIDTFTLTQPGPNPARQETAHVHQAVLDPTGQYILIPDLGADLVRVFSLDQATLKLTAVEPLAAAPGSGPRHIAFLVAKKKTYLYLLSELANSITGYEVLYNKNNTLSFSQVYLSSSHGIGNTVPSGAAAAEILLSPDSRFLIISSRNESSLTIPNFDATNSTNIRSDPLILYAIDHQNGNLTLLQEFPAGGVSPRQFSINKAGTLLAVGLEVEGRVVVIERDPTTGLLTRFLANVTVGGNVVAVIFDE